jgi:positive phototaxis protein PixI
MYSSLIASPLNPNQKSLGDAYLKIQIDGQNHALLSMRELQEVILMPVKSITPIPLMPACVRGLINRRNKVVWVIDLAEMLGFTPVAPIIQEYNIIIVKVEKFPLAFIVQAVKAVNRFPIEAIQSPLENVSAGITPYLKGCILSNEEILMVLEGKALLNSSLWGR